MRQLLKSLLEAHARRSVYARCDVWISPSAKVSYRGMVQSPPKRLVIGDGSIFNGSISCDRPGATIEIGNNTFVGGSMLVCAERIGIGSDVLISWGCTIVDHNSHSVEWDKRAADVRDYYLGKKNWEHVRISPVTICDKVWIGFHTIILPGITVGEGAVVGGGSVVTRDVAPYTVVAGNPARLIRSLK